MSPSRAPVFSYAHYFQAPATQATFHLSFQCSLWGIWNPPHIKPDACLRLKFLHRQDRISLLVELADFLNETRVAFCH